MKKTVPGNPAIMIKTFAVIENYFSNEVYEAIADVNIRKKWDTIFSEFKIIDNIDGCEVIYMRIESPTVFVSDRDFVQRRKKWLGFPEKDSICMHYRSIPHPAVPPVKKVIRGEILISGYFIKTVCTNPPKSFLTIISQTDIKGSIPSWLVNKVSQKAPKDWVVNLLNGCQMIRDRNNSLKR
jgi:hypothetical protein